MKLQKNDKKNVVVVKLAKRRFSSIILCWYVNWEIFTFSDCINGCIQLGVRKSAYSLCPKTIKLPADSVLSGDDYELLEKVNKLREMSIKCDAYYCVHMRAPTD